MIAQSLGDKNKAKGEAEIDYLLAKPRLAEAPDDDYSTVVQCTGQDRFPTGSRSMVNPSHTQH